ncbi:mCG1025719, isoform CRA_a [Mus musculus]|nr:mCG1025719, isoform CRA_a [Mus musculus]
MRSSPSPSSGDFPLSRSSVPASRLYPFVQFWSFPLPEGWMKERDLQPQRSPHILRGKEEEGHAVWPKAGFARGRSQKLPGKMMEDGINQ